MSVGGFNIDQISPNPYLTDYLLAYTYKDFIAKTLLPVAKVPKRTFRVQKLNQGPFRVPDGSTGPRGAVNQITIDASIEEFTVQDRWLEHPVDRIESREAEFALPTAAADFVAQNLNLIHEKEVATFFQDTANYRATCKSDLSAGGGAQQFDNPSSSPVQTINGMIKAQSKLPNVGWIGYEAYLALATHDQILRATAGLYPAIQLMTPIGAGGQGTGKPMAAADSIAKYFGLDMLLVGREKYNSAAEGQTDVEDFIWGKSMGFAHIVPQPTPYSVTFAACFSETLAKSGTFFLPFPGPEGSDYVRSGWNRRIVMMNQGLGSLLYNVIA